MKREQKVDISNLDFSPTGQVIKKKTTKLKIDKRFRPILFNVTEKVDLLKTAIYPIENGYIVKVIYGIVGDDKTYVKDFACKSHEEIESLMLETVNCLV